MLQNARLKVSLRMLESQSSVKCLTVSQLSLGISQLLTNFADVRCLRSIRSKPRNSQQMTEILTSFQLHPTRPLMSDMRFPLLSELRSFQRFSSGLVGKDCYNLYKATVHSFWILVAVFWRYKPVYTCIYISIVFLRFIRSTGRQVRLRRC